MGRRRSGRPTRIPRCTDGPGTGLASAQGSGRLRRSSSRRRVHWPTGANGAPSKRTSRAAWTLTDEALMRWPRANLCRSRCWSPSDAAAERDPQARGGIAGAVAAARADESGVPLVAPKRLNPSRWHSASRPAAGRAGCVCEPGGERRGARDSPGRRSDRAPAPARRTPLMRGWREVSDRRLSWRQVEEAAAQPSPRADSGASDSHATGVNADRRAGRR